MVKIAFIGAGSVEFTRDLLADLLTFEELGDVRVALHDIDPERLETAEAMARWTNERLGGRAQISTHHQAFILRFECAGENLYPRLDERIAGDEDLRRTVRVAMYRWLGYFPTESSEHSAEYLPWLMHDDAALEHFRIPVDEYVRRSEDNLAEYEEMRAALRDGRGFEIHAEGLEYAPGIVHSIITGTQRVIYGNVLNQGLIDNLPDGACVEVPCLVDGAGVQPTRIGSLPPQCAALNRTFLNVVELTAQAALEGSREHVYHAAMLDPNAAASLDLDTIRTVCDELIEAHGDALPAGVRG